MKQGRLLGIHVSCPTVGQSPRGYPHYKLSSMVFKWSSTCLLVPASFTLILGGSCIIHSIFGGLNMVAILESLSLDYSSYGQVARFIVLMELNKVQLENIIYHVILLWNVNWRYFMHSLSETILAEYVKWNKYNYINQLIYDPGTHIVPPGLIIYLQES